jgi:hypothetical protein
MKKTIAIGLSLLPVLGVVSPQASAVKFDMVATVTSQTPIFTPGQEGNLDEILGFNYEQVLTRGGAPIGSESGVVLLDSPPLVITDPWGTATASNVYTIAGLGTIEGQCSAVTVNTAQTPTTGLIAVGYWCRLENGTDRLTNVTGVVTYSGTTNLFTFQGSFDVVANIPDGL